MSGSSGVVSDVGQRFFPLDKALGLLGGAYTPQVQEAVTRLGSRMPYREAREELALLWKVDICQSSIRQLTMRHGRVAVDLVEQQRAQLEAQPKAATAKPGQVVIYADGRKVEEKWLPNPPTF